MNGNDLIKRLFRYENLVIQPRNNFYVGYPFKTVDECRKILNDMSYDPDATLIYYNDEVITAKQFTNIYGGYVYEIEEGNEQESDDGESCCSNGVCSIG